MVVEIQLPQLATASHALLHEAQPRGGADRAATYVHWADVRGVGPSTVRNHHTPGLLVTHDTSDIADPQHLTNPKTAPTTHV